MATVISKYPKIKKLTFVSNGRLTPLNQNATNGWCQLLVGQNRTIFEEARHRLSAAPQGQPMALAKQTAMVPSAVKIRFITNSAVFYVETTDDDRAGIFNPGGVPFANVKAATEQAIGRVPYYKEANQEVKFYFSAHQLLNTILLFSKWRLQTRESAVGGAEDLVKTIIPQGVSISMHTVPGQDNNPPIQPEQVQFPVELTVYYKPLYDNRKQLILGNQSAIPRLMPSYKRYKKKKFRYAKKFSKFTRRYKKKFRY